MTKWIPLVLPVTLTSRHGDLFRAVVDFGGGRSTVWEACHTANIRLIMMVWGADQTQTPAHCTSHQPIHGISVRKTND